MNLPWFVGTIFGAVSLTILNSLKRYMPISVANFMLLSIPLIFVQLGFWYGFKTGNDKGVSFVTVWFVGSAMNALMALCASFLWHHEPVPFYRLIGTFFIIAGSYLVLAK